MVKVTFNSALAQKEAKKDDPKSGEEALIIPRTPSRWTARTQMMWYQLAREEPGVGACALD